MNRVFNDNTSFSIHTLFANTNYIALLNKLSELVQPHIQEILNHTLDIQTDGNLIGNNRNKIALVKNLPIDEQQGITEEAKQDACIFLSSEIGAEMARVGGYRFDHSHRRTNRIVGHVIGTDYPTMRNQLVRILHLESPVRDRDNNAGAVLI